MKTTFELSKRQMKNVTGGGITDPRKEDRDEESTRHCFIDGELIFETICTTDEQCQNLYGRKAECY